MQVSNLRHLLRTSTRYGTQRTALRTRPEVTARIGRGCHSLALPVRSAPRRDSRHRAERCAGFEEYGEAVIP